MPGLTKEITVVIPQRPPFVMIDQLNRHDEKVTQSGFLVRKDNIFVENGRFCEAGLLENIAQTAAARAGYVSALENNTVRIGYIGAVKQLVIYALPIVGDALVTSISVVNQIFDVTIVTGTVHCNDKLLAECEMKIFIQSK